jgi:hypothetical protein
MFCKHDRFNTDVPLLTCRRVDIAYRLQMAPAICPGFLAMSGLTEKKKPERHPHGRVVLWPLVGTV